MLSSITSTSGTSNTQSQAVDRFFTKVDANSDGKIARNELAQSLKTDSVSLSSKRSAPSVDDFFKALDTGNKGYITKQDATAALANGAQSAKASQSTGKQGGSGGMRRAGGTGSPFASTAPDPADTNGDGKVSIEEELAYLIKQYTTTDTSTKSTVSAYA